MIQYTLSEVQAQYLISIRWLFSVVIICQIGKMELFSQDHIMMSLILSGDVRANYASVGKD